MTNQSTKQDIYTRVTTRILAELEQGVRPWIKPWSVEHAAGHIDLPGLIWSRTNVRLDRNRGGHGHAQKTVHTRRGHPTSADG